MNYGRTRAIGMGTAFTAVESGLESALYNPATFQYIEAHKGLKFSVLFNPVVSAGLYNLYNNDSREGISTGDWYNVFRTLPKAIVLSSEKWEFGLINHEELETRSSFHKQIKFVEGDHFFQHHVENFIARIKLAKQVQLGAAVQYYSAFVEDSLQHGFGASYGVFIKPHSKLNVGVVFVNLPVGMKNVRVNHDRFNTESVNVGFAYRPFSQTTIALDVRNLSEESQTTTREIHFGVEQGIFNQIYLRSGFYRDRFNKKNRFSFGIGLLNLNMFRLDDAKYYGPNLAINYALMVEPNELENRRWHFLTVQWGFGW